MKPRFFRMLLGFALLLFGLSSCGTTIMQPTPNSCLFFEKGQGEIAGELSYSGSQLSVGYSMPYHVALLGSLGARGLNRHYRPWDGEIGLGYWHGSKSWAILVAGGIGGGRITSYGTYYATLSQGEYYKPFVQINFGLQSYPSMRQPWIYNDLRGILKVSWFHYQGTYEEDWVPQFDVNSDFMIIEPGLMTSTGYDNVKFTFTASLPIKTPKAAGIGALQILPFQFSMGVRFFPHHIFRKKEDRVPQGLY